MKQVAILKSKKVKLSIRILFLFALFVGAFACTNDADSPFNGQLINNELIKSVTFNGIITQKYLYDNYGRIKEDQGKYFYHRYLYDGNGRLVKIETAVDTYGLTSSTIQPPKTELMTSANSTINSYRLFYYDNDGNLLKIENYFIKTGENFELTSINSFEYEGALICKTNLCNEKGQIAHYYEYSYDINGNIAKEKYYSCMFTGVDNPELINETTYKYDDYKNPYQILNISEPKFYTSPNNMIVMTTKWYTNDLRTETSWQTFIYNDKGYPVRMIYEGGEEEYTY